MKNLILFLLLLPLWVIAKDHTVTKVEDDTLFIERSEAAVGTSGIVLHKINESYETILARVEVMANEANVTKLKVVAFEDLFQEALPKLKMKPSVGDRVRLEWMHDRVLLIAPSQESYQIVSSAQRDKSFVNSDLFAVKLSREGHPSPLKEDFQNFCADYNIGVVQLIIGKKLYKVDCYSFKVLERIDVDFPDTETKVPFYSRVKEINADWWGEGSDEITDYPAYYKKLLGEK